MEHLRTVKSADQAKQPSPLPLSPCSHGLQEPWLASLRRAGHGPSGSKADLGRDIGRHRPALAPVAGLAGGVR